ncbi:MAG: hypothetical protein KA010_03430 [Saprospiraceae bacterium]|nr:hypothetical protein [Saprospiraceae bacterium]
MNGAHFHLVVNHLPIVFPLVGIIVMIIGFVSKSDAVKRTSYFIFVLGALFSILSMTSGEGAEDIVKKINGIDKKLIHTHEEAAETFALLTYVLGVLSLFGLWASFSKKSFSNLLYIITLAFALVCMVFAKQTGTTGGEIRHTEIREGAALLMQDSTVSEPSREEGDH